jgi:precorrin-2/cobalt-factor-2 C20-methyltransferase
VSAPGVIWGVGLGPGDPELMSVRAWRLVSQARRVAYFRKRGHPGQARRIVEGLLAPEATEIPLEYPVTTEIPVEDDAYGDALRAFYAESVERLLAAAGEGDVVVLCEGDPFFYGSFMHLHERLAGRAAVRVVPGITGMSACWTATGAPFCWGDDVTIVLMGTLPEATLAARMRAGDAVAVMKLGRNLPKVRRALAEAGLADRAWYVERGSAADQRVMRLADKTDDAAPYFSIVLVHGRGRRP